MLDLIEKIAAAVAVKGSQWPIYGGGELDRTEFLTSSENTRCLRELKFNKLTPPEIGHWEIGRASCRERVSDYV